MTHYSSSQTQAQYNLHIHESSRAQLSTTKACHGHGLLPETERDGYGTGYPPVPVAILVTGPGTVCTRACCGSRSSALLHTAE
jgi:hypothetical protein